MISILWYYYWLIIKSAKKKRGKSSKAEKEKLQKLEEERLKEQGTQLLYSSFPAQNVYLYYFSVYTYLHFIYATKLTLKVLSSSMYIDRMGACFLVNINFMKLELS